ncbi:uncharacterized protein BDZ99DRAFT_380384, partial [Mytilinidion resinicola]
LDVSVQHHPECVSLAWGAMKLLFILVENHGKLVKTLSKGLTQIADALPRIELANILYPTAQMQQAVFLLYSHVIRYFIRAEEWYQQSEPRHAWEAFARPAEIRYNDLIADIVECTKEVESLATAGAQAEQRDMHLEIRDLGKRLRDSETLLLEMRGLLISYQCIQTSANLDTNVRLTDLQLNQIMDFLSGANKLDPIKALGYRLSIGRRHRERPRNAESGPAFWLSPKFSTWESSSSPALIMVKSDYTHRLRVQNFMINVINVLRGQQIPVIWAIKGLSPTGPSAAPVVDIVKGLVCQAIPLNVSLHTEHHLAFNCAQFRAAETPEQWFDLLARVIANLPQLHIIVDIEAVGTAYTHAAIMAHGFSWLSTFLAMFQKYSFRKWIARLKILLISYGSAATQMRDLAKH